MNFPTVSKVSVRDHAIDRYIEKIDPETTLTREEIYDLLAQVLRGIVDSGDCSFSFVENNKYYEYISVWKGYHITAELGNVGVYFEMDNRDNSVALTTIFPKRKPKYNNQEGKTLKACYCVKPIRDMIKNYLYRKYTCLKKGQELTVLNDKNGNLEVWRIERISKNWEDVTMRYVGNADE